jgi:NodT family efflux transporter outer membrane factor (OMF) lipoprotein
MRRAILLLSASATLLAACSGVTARKPDTRVPVAYEAPAAATDAALPAQALDQWWLLFNDPQLTGLIETALANAPDAKSALARLDEARANRSQAFFSTLPQGNLQGNAQTQNTEVLSGNNLFSPAGRVNTYSANFNVSWELDLFGRSRAALRAARADLAAARFDYEATRMSLADQTAQALFQARSIATQLADARESLRISQELSRVAGIRVERGLGSRGDAARINTDLAAAQAEAARLEAALAPAKRNLLVLIGRGSDPLDSLPIEPVAALAPLPPAGTPGDILQRRPDVREAEARLDAALGRLSYDKLALFPTITLRPGVSISESTGGFELTQWAWTLAGGAVIPVLDRPKLLAAARASGARAEQAVIAYEKAVQAAYAEAENALNTVAGDRTRVERLAEAEAQARYAFNAADTGYKAGLSDLNTLLDAERRWRQARSQASGIRSQALIDASAAFKALGGGWTPVADRAATSTPVTAR